MAGLTEQGVQLQWKFSSRSEQNQPIATWFELLNVGEKQHFLLKKCNPSQIIVTSTRDDSLNHDRSTI